jgi:branched-chain amino acid transport system substrate-binding protein
VEFRLLGLLEVADDGPIRIVRGRESALLALLLLSSNKPLSTDQIVEELWGAAAPENAAKSVHIYVSRLRKALGADRIQTTSAGYRLRVESGELDCERFYRYAAEGRRQEALALWRGEPLADFRFEAFAQSEIRRLEALRDDLWMDELDARIDAGSVAETIPDLRTLVEREPLWERPRGQLMRALYLAGRQSEALELYRSTRTLLSDELGVEPGRELQRLERAILKQDPELGTPTRPTRSPAERRHHRLLIGGALLVAAAAAAIVAVELSRAGKQATLPYVPDSLARIDSASGRIDGVLPFAGTPGAVAIANDSAWVASTNGTISAVALDSMQNKHLVAPGLAAGQIVSSGGRLWALGADGGTIAEIDPVYGTRLHRIPLPVSQDNVGVRIAPALAGGVWITNGKHLLRYDQAGNRIASVDLHRPLTDVVAGLGRLWVLSGPTATLLELNQRTAAALGTIRLELRAGDAAPLPIALTVGSGAVWILDGSPPSVIRVDPRIGAVETTVPLAIGSDPTSIAAGHGQVWVTDSGDGTLARISASTNSPHWIVVGGNPTDIAIGQRNIWVTLQSGLSANNGGVPSPLAVPQASTIGLPSTICSPIYSEGQPKVILAADLPLQGGGGTLLSLQLSDAIRYELALHHFRAGSLPVGYQLCDDSSASTGSWTPATCRVDAKAIAANSAVVGVVGPFNSGCAITELPILAHAKGGAVPVISPSATYSGLTHGGVGSLPGEPTAYRANGQPIFMRVVAADDRQGPANAVLAKRFGVRRLYLLEDGSAYGRGITAALETAAAGLGIKIVGRTEWPRDTAKYHALAGRVALARPDGVFLAGTIDEGGAPLLQSLRHTLGTRPHILLSDGFTPFPAVIDVGRAAEGATITIPAPALSRLPKAGRDFVNAFAKAIGQQPQPYSVAAAEATQAMLTALATSNPTRSSLRQQLLRTPSFNGILGNFRFDQNGDTTNPVVSVYTIKNGQALLLTTITPPTENHP